ncbi:MAG: TetR/AcrR family transcriptional regulator [Deltaproteobacteria bacterium]|nr:TetR/AcrR family transcriptional regulator [Deltaproteobacteria bacterium]
MIERKTSEERKEEITAAAIKILSEKGSKKFTSSALAKEVGLSSGAIFRHFDTITEIADFIVEKVYFRLSGQAVNISDDPIENIELFLLKPLKFISEYPGIIKIIFSGQLELVTSPQSSEKLRSLQRHTFEFIRTNLIDASEKGFLRENTDVDALTVIITGTLLSASNQVSSNFSHQKSSDELNQAVLKQLVKLIRG